MKYLAIPLTFMVIPLVASAAWWNPLSWTSSENEAAAVLHCEPEIVEKIIEVEKIVYATTTATSTEVITEVVEVPRDRIVEVERIVEKIVEVPVEIEKIVEVPIETSQDSTHLVALEAENNLLRSQIQNLKSRIDILENDNAGGSVQNTAVSNKEYEISYGVYSGNNKRVSWRVQNTSDNTPEISRMVARMDFEVESGFTLNETKLNAGEILYQGTATKVDGKTYAIFYQTIYNPFIKAKQSSQEYNFTLPTDSRGFLNASVEEVKIYTTDGNTHTAL